MNRCKGYQKVTEYIPVGEPYQQYAMTQSPTDPAPPGFTRYGNFVFKTFTPYTSLYSVEHNTPVSSYLTSGQKCYDQIRSNNMTSPQPFANGRQL